MGRYNYYQIFLLALLLLLVSCGTSPEEDAKYDSKRAGKSVVETGELAAVNSRSFVLPRYGRYWYEMRVIGLLEHGTIVNEGDSIIQIDPTDIKKSIIDWESDLETQLANLEKLQVDQENSVKEQESQLRSELSSFDLKKIERDASRFETEKMQRIKALEFKQAEINLAKVKRKMELNRIINASNLRIQEIRVEQVRNRIQNAYDILPTLTIHTPISGVFQLGWNRRTGAMLKIGDNVYPGTSMANVPELKRMKVNTFVNENDFLKISLGQKVTVRLDALPKVVFEGEVAYVGKLCHRRDRNSREKVFDVEVNILQSDERLKPGMTVSCEYLD